MKCPIHPIPGFVDPVSSMTHLLGALLFGVLSIFLLRKGRGHRGRQVALGIFAFSVVLMFSMSGVFHMLPHDTTGRAVLQRLDHASIFVLIAGSFTAPHSILFRGRRRWGVLFLVWALAATIIPLKMVYFDRLSEPLGLALYLGMGWIGLYTGLLVWRMYGPVLLIPLMLGGLSYTAGALLEFARWPNPIPGVVHAHELFHLAVIGGVACHWWFCSHFAAGRPPTCHAPVSAEA